MDVKRDAVSRMLRRGEFNWCMTYSNFRNDNVRGGATEFNCVVCHDYA